MGAINAILPPYFIATALEDLTSRCRAGLSKNIHPSSAPFGSCIPPPGRHKLLCACDMNSRGGNRKAPADQREVA
jgi:hypothetical protein